MVKITATCAALCVAAGLSCVDAHAKYLERMCSVQLKQGVEIMGAPVAASTTQTVTVQRGDKALASGDAYEAGEKLTVSADLSGEVIFEVQGGGLTGGHCDGNKRMVPTSKTKSSVEFTAPADGFDVSLYAAWAAEHGEVTVTQPFVLKGTKGARDGSSSIVSSRSNSTTATTTNTTTTAASPNTTTTAITTSLPSTGRRYLRHWV